MPEAAPAGPSTRPAPRSGRRASTEPIPAPRRSRRIAAIDVRPRSAARCFLIDLAIAAAVVAVAFFFEVADEGRFVEPLDRADFAAGALAAALILLRRHAPIPVLVAALAAGVWSLIPSDDQGVLRVATCLALYTVASTTSRRTAWTAGTVCAAVLFATATITTPGPWYDGDNLELIAWTAVATAAGDAVRSRRAYVIAREERAAALEERAERAEQALQEEARRQVAEERLRIARELHDVVAHHIAVINVQAGVAAHLIREDPAAAEEALSHVRRGASSVLGELSGMLNMMRRPEDPTSTDPLPTLDQLDALIADFSGAGLDVERHTTGVRQPVPPVVALAAYRIVQESLTNAHRHGSTPRACLRVDYRPDALSVEVVNDAAAVRPPNRSGHGITGMRERVAAAGGTIDVGPTGDGRFRVHATLPLSGGDL